MKNKAIIIPVTAFGGSQHPCPYISPLLSDAFRKYFRPGQKQGLGCSFSTQTRLIPPALLNTHLFVLLVWGREKGSWRGLERARLTPSGVTDLPLVLPTQPTDSESPGGMIKRLGGLHSPHLPPSVIFLKGRHKPSVMGLASDTTGFRSWPHHLIFSLPSASHSTNLSLYFLIYKMRRHHHLRPGWL